jgi:SPP1 gp7 family putative phage head morphogenesis protein
MKYRTVAAKKTASLRKARRTRQPTSPLRLDPTRTVTLRRVFLGKIRRQFRRLKALIAKVIGQDNYLGLVSETTTANAQSIYSFGNSQTKLKGFQYWLKAQLDSHIVGQTERQIWQEYVEQGFKKGAGRAFDDAQIQRPKKKSKKSPKVSSTAGQGGSSVLLSGDYTTQTKDEFLRSSFGQPVAIEKAQLLASRTFEELEAVTYDMSNRMSRVMVDGLVQGKNPVEVARDLSEEVDISRGRAERIARTEIIRAHAEGQLTALEQMGVKEVGAQVEWATAGDSLVCPKCAGLEGKILSIEKARGMLPLHPNCRCCWLPYFSDLPDTDGGKKAGDDSGDDDADFAFEDTQVEPVSVEPTPPQTKKKAKSR